MSKLGTITEEQFNDEILEFVAKSHAINENWFIRENKSTSACKYLVKRQTIAFLGPDKQDNGSIDDCGDELGDFDSSVCSPVHASNVQHSSLTYEYHVVYSPSYSVPVLYFNAWTQDGKLLLLQQIWDQVSQIHQHFLQHDKWSFITQQEHPLLNRPFFSIHPCHTADFMRSLQTGTDDVAQSPCSYLTSWLSAVGPVVGLELPLRFAVEIEHTEFSCSFFI